MPQKSQKAFLISYFKIAFFMFLGILLLSGCASLSDPEATQTYHNDIVGNLDQTYSLEQTIQTRQSRIDGIFLWLQSNPISQTQTGKIMFELFNPPDSSSPWTTTSIRCGAYRPDQPLYITFQPQEKASSDTYRFVIKAVDCSVQIFGRAEDNYAAGVLTQNSAPLPGDIAFRLKYQYDMQSFWDDFISLLPHVWLVVIAFLFFIIPGSLWLSVFDIKDFFNSTERIGLVIALSMALPVCMMEWTSVINFRWTQITARTVYVTLALIYVFGVVKTGFQNPSFEIKNGIFRWLGRNRHLLVLCLIFLFTLTIRLIMIRDLAAPPWVDSVHHALLTRIIMEKGMFPDTYSPYIIADNARYHPGYHVTLAIFQWLSGLELQKGMLLYGQLLNAILVFGVFLLTKSLTKNNTTGIFTPMPAYYTSWGRYTQLAGLVIMPAAFAVIDFILSSRFKEIEGKRQRVSIFFLAGILCAALFIIHYRVIVFLALLLIAFIIIKSLSSIKNKSLSKSIRSDLLEIFTIVVVAVLFSLPWLPGALGEFIVPRIESSLQGDTAFAGHSWAYLTSGLGTWTLYLAMGGIIVGIFRGKKFPWTLIVWVVLLFGMANMNMLRLPMSGFINNTSVEITLFLPIAVLGSYFVVSIIDGIGRWLHGKWVIAYDTIIVTMIISLSL
jgi:hypothetical protein